MLLQMALGRMFLQLLLMVGMMEIILGSAHSNDPRNMGIMPL
nr:hypothetical protein Q903MT_gene4646 [Picea sitchensis]